MCGISGIVNLAERPRPTAAELQRMITRLEHRGPDGYGYYHDQEVGLAHARLSIIDLEGGDQPIHNEDRSIQLVFNGEIFNYIELRRELEKKRHRFYTRSDTEVIVHLYEQHGEGFVSHLNGQFAIALWDSRKKRLILARDRVGIRPLFYTVVKERLLFASEIKALFACPEVERKLNHAALGQIFTYWSALAPHSIFEGILALPPGHLMVVEDGALRVEKYWDWEFPEEFSDRRSADDLATELRELLIDSVRLRLRSDVPVGAYLSGGLDSSVTTSLIKHYTDTPLRTFSVGFEEGEFDESSYQRRLVEYLGTDHSHVLCRKTDICEQFPRVIWHTESPVLRTAPTPLMILSGMVRDEGYKVVLTGEGADEVLGGYDIFKEAKIRRFWGRFPGSSMRPAILGRLYPYLGNNPVANPAYAQQFFRQGMEYASKPYFGHIPRWMTTRRSWQFLSQELRAALPERQSYADLEATLPSAIKSWKGLNRDQYIEAHTLMSGYLLSSQGDRVAMANSIEGRFPFLDHRVIEFANKLPQRYKIMGLNEKYLLKRAMRGLIPEQIRTRSKQPYRAPDSHSFFTDGRPAEYVEYLLGEQRIGEAGYFDPAAVGKLLNKCARGRAIGFADNMAFTGILSTMLLDEMYIRGAYSGNDGSLPKLLRR